MIDNLITSPELAKKRMLAGVKPSGINSTGLARDKLGEQFG